MRVCGLVEAHGESQAWPHPSRYGALCHLQGAKWPMIPASIHALILSHLLSFRSATCRCPWLFVKPRLTTRRTRRTACTVCTVQLLPRITTQLTLPTRPMPCTHITHMLQQLFTGRTPNSRWEMWEQGEVFSELEVPFDRQTWYQ